MGVAVRSVEAGAGARVLASAVSCEPASAGGRSVSPTSLTTRAEGQETSTTAQARMQQPTPAARAEQFLDARRSLYPSRCCLHGPRPSTSAEDAGSTMGPRLLRTQPDDRARYRSI